MIQLEAAKATDSPVAMGSRWHADLELELAQTERGCRLARSRHRGPLYVQKPFYPEGRDLAHVYLLHPPGGLVSGDKLDIRVDMGADARGLVTTTGAGRVYRARSDGLAQCQDIHLRLAAGSSLEWLPLENIVYPGANARFRTIVELAPGSRFAGWEITSLGLPARAECFSAGTLTQRLEIRRDGAPLFVESLDLGGGGTALLETAAGLRGYPVSGLFVIGPCPGALDDATQRRCLELLDEHAPGCLAGITQVGEFWVARTLGHCAFRARALFAQLWASVRPALLHRAACPPRIWST